MCIDWRYPFDSEAILARMSPMVVVEGLRGRGSDRKGNVRSDVWVKTCQCAQLRDQ